MILNNDNMDKCEFKIQLIIIVFREINLTASQLFKNNIFPNRYLYVLLNISVER